MMKSKDTVSEHNLDLKVPVRWITELTIDDSDISIRPVEHRDVNLEQEFTDRLPRKARQVHFPDVSDKVTVNELLALCSVDYHDSMAFIATHQHKEKVQEVGLARYHKAEDETDHEMEVVVAEEFRNTCLSAVLANSLIGYAKQHGVTTLKLIDRYNNPDVQALAEQLDLVPKIDDSHQVTYTILLK